MRVVAEQYLLLNLLSIPANSISISLLFKAPWSFIKCHWYTFSYDTDQYCHKGKYSWLLSPWDFQYHCCLLLIFQISKVFSHRNHRLPCSALQSDRSFFNTKQKQNTVKTQCVVELDSFFFFLLFIFMSLLHFCFFFVLVYALYFISVYNYSTFILHTQYIALFYFFIGFFSHPFPI